MKANALTDTTTELPKAQVLIELSNGQMLPTTGFIIRKDKHGEPTIIIKASKNCRYAGNAEKDRLLGVK